MSPASWIRGVFGTSKPNPHFLEARAAIADLAHSTGELNSDLQKLPFSPFRAIVLDLQRQHKVSEYDQRQAAKIYDEKIPR